MKTKTVAVLIILIFSMCCLSIVSAEDNYIMPTSINNNEITFSDGFIGFCLDLTKNDINTTDTFTESDTQDDELQNYIKLAIIECYDEGRENDIENIVTSFVDGSYVDSSDEIIKDVLESDDIIKDEVIEDIDNNTQATFTFKLLKSTDDNKSDCIAYKVSLKTVPEKLASQEDSDKSDDSEKQASNQENDNTETNLKENNNTNNSTKTDSKETINETNITITNKTNTIIINENNTTTINQNNVKTINKTNDTPENNTLLKTVGNPIFILVVVIVIIAVISVILNRKD